MFMPTSLKYPCLLFLVCMLNPTSAQEPRKQVSYDFRASEQYRALDASARLQLEQVVKDLSQLERALDSFMKDHAGAPPQKLEELVPDYIDALPHDPFAASEQQLPEYLQRHQRSLDGRGYLYLQKPNGVSIQSYDPLTFAPSPGAWQIQSIGILNFPLRYRKSNPGLIRTRGYWGRIQLDVF